MEDSYIYVLQVNIALAVFYQHYRIAFARDTFFVLRRFFLLTITAFSFLCPLVSLAGWLEDKEPLQAMLVDYTNFFVSGEVVTEQVKESSFKSKMVY